MTELARYVPPDAAELRETWKLAEQLAKTEFVAKAMRDKPEAVFACILTGRELGIGPMQALRDVYLINGRPGLAATLMVARVRAAGHGFCTLANDDQGATVQIHRRGEPEPEPAVTFTLDDARRAKLAAKDVWQQYPGRMCWSRAASACCRRDAPEVLGGVVYTPEELDSGTATAVTTGEFTYDRVTGELLDNAYDPATDGSPPPSVADFPRDSAGMRAAQQQSSTVLRALRRRAQTEALRQREGQTSGAGEREPVKSDGEGAGIDRDDPAPDSPSPVGHDSASSGPPATATASTTVGHLARGLEMDPNDAVRRLASHPHFKGVTVSAKTTIPGEQISALRAFLTEGGEGS